MANFTVQKAQQLAERMGGVEAASILALTDVESNGLADIAPGMPSILYEAHIFSRETRGAFDRSHPRISSPSWDRSLYVGGRGEYDRLNQAMALDATAALRSASWGLPQIMGFNHRPCRFNTVEEFVSFIKGDDDADMECFVRFIEAHPVMLNALRLKDWPTFTYHYNGPGQVTVYSGRIATAYLRRSGMMPGAPIIRAELPLAEPVQKVKVARPLLYMGCPKSADVEAVQRVLNIKVDGWFGTNTDAAVRVWQHTHGLKVDGKVAEETYKSMGLA